MTTMGRLDRMDELYAEFSKRRPNLLEATHIDRVQSCIIRGLKVDMFWALELLDTMTDEIIISTANTIGSHLDVHDRQYTRQEALEFLPDRMIQDLT